VRFEHLCEFCDWRRLAASPTILAPAACPVCGCALASRAVAPGGAATADPREAEWTLGPRGVAAVRPMMLVAMLGLAAALTSAGYSAGGIWTAIGGLGLAGFLALPLIPSAR
jgi:hypothetical protein